MNNTTKIIATGNTYPARTQLREAGFVWDKNERVWTIDAEKFDLEEWARVNESATYSRANMKACSGVELVTRTVTSGQRCSRLP